MTRLFLVAVLLFCQAGCAAPAWLTAAEIVALTGTATAIVTLDTEVIKVVDEHNPPEPAK